MLATQIHAYFLTTLVYQYAVAAPDNPPIPSFNSATDSRIQISGVYPTSTADSIQLDSLIHLSSHMISTRAHIKEQLMLLASSMPRL